jgi:ATP-binding cassette subfamily B multidrug efflux pump
VREPFPGSNRKSSCIALNSASKSSVSLAHVEAAGRGRGLGVLVRITRMALRHPWQVGFALGSAVVAAILQLMIPRLLGSAVDQTQTVLTAGAQGHDASGALWTTALALLAVSVCRGIFTMLQNYFGEAVGHHVGYQLRLAGGVRLNWLEPETDVP